MVLRLRFFNVGLPMGLLVVPSCGSWVGLSVNWGLRYRLLWFWVFRWVFPMGLSVSLGLRYRLLWFWVFR